MGIDPTGAPLDVPLMVKSYKLKMAAEIGLRREGQKGHAVFVPFAFPYKDLV